jgi:antitoxin ParD1/3/4
MNVDLPADLQAFVQAAINSGGFKNAGDVVGEALRLLQRRERLRADVNAGLEQLERGHFQDHDEHALGAAFDALKRTGRNSLRDSDSPR